MAVINLGNDRKREKKKGKERKVTRRKGNVFARLPRDDDRERSFVTFYCLIVNAFQRQRFLLDRVPSYEIFDGDDGERASQLISDAVSR